MRKPATSTDDPDAIAKAHAIYTSGTLRLYDLVVHGVSNHLAWRCPTARLIDLYRGALSRRHLEAGVGTGFFIDRARPAGFDELVMLDINRECLERSARRLARYAPQAREVNLLAPIFLDIEPVDSVGLTYVLHCLPGSLRDKLRVVDHLRPSMKPGATLFGATILGRGIAPNAFARVLLRLYNEKGIFNNRDDDIESLTDGLRSRFGEVTVEQIGCVATFRAR
jgi:SAM-dependent methyltransferase